MPRSRKLRRKAVGRLGRLLLWSFERWMRGKTALQAERAGRRLGRALFRFSSKHRLRALDNLKLAFPEMQEKGRFALAVKVFEHFGMLATDFMRTTSRTDQEVAAHMEVDDSAREIVDGVLAGGKGMLAVTAHFGNWERFAQFARTQGKEIFAVARDADDAKVQADVLRLRELTGLTVISRGNAAKTMISLLRENRIVALLPDQNSSERFLPFFGLPTGTVLGPATISLRTGAPMVPCFCARIGPGQYRTYVFPPLEPAAGVEDKVEALTRSMNDAIEQVIRKHPEQWLWFHDRWKSARQRGLL